MESLKSKLNELDVNLVLLDIDSPGYYVPAWRTVFVNQDLTYLKMKLVILHELKHVLDHGDYVDIYDHFVPRTKMERQANDFMLRSMIEENDGEYNYSMLVDEFKLHMGWDSHYEIK